MTPELKQLKKDYMQLFSTDLGKKILLDLQNHCFKKDTTAVSEYPHNINIKDTMLLNEGKRQVLLHIETMMSPEGMETEGASSSEGR